MLSNQMSTKKGIGDTEASKLLTNDQYSFIILVI